jgi:transcriptional regulator with XRE-family HTH domain
MGAKTPKQPFVPRTPGERIAHARRLLGVREGADLLPPHLAKRVGVTTNAVYAWEEDTLPGRDNLQKLADELGVTPEWIHYGVPRGNDVIEAASAEPTRHDVDAVRERQRQKRDVEPKQNAGGDRSRPTRRPKPR